MASGPLARPGAVAAGGAPLGQLPQPAHLGVAGGAGTGRQVGRHQRQVEGARPAELGGPLHHAGVAGEAAGLLGARAQVGGGRGRQPAVELVQAAPGPHRGQGGGQRTAGRGGVVDVVGGHHLDPGPRSASAARASLRAESSGSPWSHSSTATLVAAEQPRCSRSSSRGRRRPGRAATRAAGTVPLRQPVRTSQWSATGPVPTAARPRPGPASSSRARVSRSRRRPSRPGQLGLG